MRRLFISVMLLIMSSAVSSAIERLVFMGGISRQDPGGAVKLQPGYSFQAGGGAELVDNLYAIVKFSIPAKYTGDSYPTIVNVNEMNDTLNYQDFTIFDLEVTGHYIFPVFEESKVNPKVFGGLGVHWLYNSLSKSGEPDLEIHGIGPEFGLGAVYLPSDNLQFDFTASVKFPYYNEYDKQNADKLAVGLDQQVICVNFSVYYLFGF